MINLNTLPTFLADGGPVYFETNPEAFIVEPWNAYSSLLFLLPVAFWLFKLKGEYQKYPFLMYCMPLLFLGGIGSTLYHAFRSSQLLLMMDVLPIAILTLSIGMYMWYKIINHKFWVALIALAFIGIRFPLFWIFKDQVAVNIGYFLTGTMMFIPMIIFLFKTNFNRSFYLVLTIVFFGLALYFRRVDDFSSFYIPLQMGTHWLWHLFTAAGAMPLAAYLYFVAKKTSPAALQRVEVRA